ncbi:MAG: bacteriophage abortive infection AbiH family protein [Bacteroidetes bacterium]|nr:bacteriophage abortive infection AbiH family protein [Bacteroidota bacterium]
MNRIILIGNGFDLAHRLETKYEHFIDWFWKKEFKKIGRLKQVGIEKFSSENDFFTISAKYDDYNIVNDCQNMSFTQFNNLISNPKLSHNNYEITFKNKFLETLLNNFYLQNWVDIEEIYYNALKRIVFDKNEIPNVIVDLGEIVYSAIDKLNYDFQEIKNELETYLKRENTRTFPKISEIEELIYQMCEKVDFTSKGVENFVEQECNKFIRGYKEKQLTEREKINIENISNDILGKDAPFLPPPNEYLFLNFNYTDTPSQYMKKDNIFVNDKNISNIHIHGKLQSIENPMIFGYGDELDDDYKIILKKKDNKLLKNVKSVKYAETYNYKHLLNFIESDCYQVFIMGHSCGNSDRTLLNKLFEHKNCQSIKIFYHEWKEKDKDGNDIMKDNFSDVYSNIMRNFTDFSELRAKVVDKTNSVPLPQV